MSLSTIITIITGILIAALIGRARHMNGDDSPKNQTESSSGNIYGNTYTYPGGISLTKDEEQKKETLSKSLEEDEKIEAIANVSENARNELEQFVAITNKRIIISDRHGYGHRYSYDELKNVKITNGAGMKTTNPELAYMITFKTASGGKYCFIKGSGSFVPLAKGLMQRF